MKRTLKSLLRKVQVFDYVSIVVIGTLFVATFLFFMRKPTTVNIRVKLTDEDVLYAGSNPAVDYAERFKVGDVEKDGLGRNMAEITKVFKYDLTRSKIIYLDLAVRTTYDKRTGFYYAKGKPLIYGTPIKFNFSQATFSGIVTELPENIRKATYEIVDYEVDTVVRGAQSYSSDGALAISFIEPEILMSLRVGDQVLDSDGNVIVEIKDVIFKPSKRQVVGGNGKLVVLDDPIYKDAYIKLKVRAKTIGNDAFFMDKFPVRLNEGLPLVFEKLTVWPLIVDVKKS